MHVRASASARAGACRHHRRAAATPACLEGVLTTVGPACARARSGWRTRSTHAGRRCTGAGVAAMYEVNHGATKSHRHRMHRPARLLTSWWAALCRGRPAACVQAARRSAPRCRQWSVCSQQEGVAERASASSSSALAGACRCACTRRRRAVPHTAARLSPHSRAHSPRVWSCYCRVCEAGRSAPSCEMPRRASQAHTAHGVTSFSWLRMPHAAAARPPAQQRRAALQVRACVSLGT
jgi:hypothetical protein